MGIFDSPKPLFGLRIIQLVFGLVFLVVLAYSNQHRGYWYKLEGPVALGVVSFLFTLFLCAHGIWEFVKKSYSLTGKAALIVRVVVEFLVFLMWIGTATLMLRPRSRDFNHNIFDLPPTTTWNIGIIFSFLEIVAFILTNILTILHFRKGGSGGISTSYV